MYVFMYNHSAMRYIYDPIKKAANLKKHGLDFDDAKTVIESANAMVFEDCRHNYGERRFGTIGFLRGILVVIITTETTEIIRIISMRKANKNEQKNYFTRLG